MSNFLSSVGIIGVLFLFYYISPYFSSLYFFNEVNFYILGKDVAIWMWQVNIIFLFFLLLGLFIYYFSRPLGYKGKPLYVLFLIKKVVLGDYSNIAEIEKQSILAIIVKAFWGPLMLYFLIKNLSWISDIVYNISNYNYHNFLYFFKDHLFWLILSFLLFVDVLIFTIGYWVEFDFLNNKIKSVDDTLLGWIVALACYPPFNVVPNKLWGRYSKDLPFMNTDFIYLSFGLGIIVLFLFGIYLRASIALGFKASNMTNRGIVTRGPYRFVRHPAYSAKFIAWVLGSLGYFYLAIRNMDIVMVFKILLFLFGVGALYFLRAITEERHLMNDKDYRDYVSKVKYRFIPGFL